jgi:ZIP family zinc transporter
VISATRKATSTTTIHISEPLRRGVLELRLRYDAKWHKDKALSDLAIIAVVSGAAGLASVLGGLIAVWRKPTTLFMSASLGFASGVLLATIAFEMMPEAIELGSVAVAAAGFVGGFGAVYAFDLFVHRGQVAGKESAQRRRVQLYYRRRRPRTRDVVVLAGGTSAEELIEGVAIGAGTIVEPSLGVLIAVAIAIDNLSEGLSVGELIRAEATDLRNDVKEILRWTATIGLSLVVSSIVGWLLFRELPSDVLALLFAVGAGGMFYLTVTDLLPQAEARQYQESSAIANGVGFLLIMVLSSQF